jgi:hypothetical protein
VAAVVRLTASLLARQTPAVRAALAKAQSRGSLVTHEVAREGDVVLITLRGLKMPSLANESAWKVANRAKKIQRDALNAALAEVRPPLPPFPWDVEIMRYAPRALDVGGNLYTSGKRLQDTVARWCGVDDATDETVRYTVRQEIGPVAVVIRIGPRTVT